MESKNELPEELKGWSWGPFLLNWIWAISNKTWWGLFAVVPYLGFFVALYLGFKGRELAWKNNDWESFEQFDAVQKKWSFWGAWLIGGLFIAGTLLAVVLPATHQIPKGELSNSSQLKRVLTDEEVGFSTAENNGQPKEAMGYGLGIKSREEYQNAVNSYRLKIRTGEAHVFDAFPIQYLQSEEKAWPKEEVPKIGFLWWYEGDDIFMVLINNHPRIPIEKVLLGMNYGSCGSADQTKYPVDLGASIKPGYFAVAKLSNDALFKFAYQVKDGLNSEEQERWRSDRKEKNDCIDIKDAWFKF